MEEFEEEKFKKRKEKIGKKIAQETNKKEEQERTVKEKAGKLEMKAKKERINTVKSRLGLTKKGGLVFIECKFNGTTYGEIDNFLSISDKLSPHKLLEI